MRDFLKSFTYAGKGIVAAFKVGLNFKVQLCFALIAIILGLAFPLEPGEWAAIFICIGVVLGGECINTAIESAVDLASPEFHDLAERSKDCAAGGVLIASIASVAVAFTIFIPKLVSLLG